MPGFLIPWCGVELRAATSGLGAGQIVAALLTLQGASPPRSCPDFAVHWTRSVSVAAFLNFALLSRNAKSTTYVSALVAEKLQGANLEAARRSFAWG